MKVRVKKLSKNAVIPSYAKAGDAGMDFTAIAMEVNKDYIEYFTGIAVEIPEGHVGLIFPRSSISKTNLTLSNSVGVIDCVPAGTKIKLSTGNDILVEDLYKEYKSRTILSFNDTNNEFEEDVINQMWIVHNKNLIEIEDEYGDVIQIPETKEIYTSRGWIAAKDLTESDTLLKF